MLKKHHPHQSAFNSSLHAFCHVVRFLLQHIGFVENCEGSLIPLVPEGLKGVIFSPLLHGNLEHIASNSVPIAALLFLLYQFYPKLANPVFFTDGLLQDS